MPYRRERADKTAHQAIVENPTVGEFYKQCEHLREPTDGERAAMVAEFRLAPDASSARLPERVIAVDGSWYEGQPDPGVIPSTRLGYVQIGGVVVDMRALSKVWIADTGLVDPFAVSRLDESSDRLIFPLPSSNVRYRGMLSVREGFRHALDEHLDSVATRYSDDPDSSLRSTLFRVAAYRDGPLATDDHTVLLLHRCPYDECDETNVRVEDAAKEQKCPRCDRVVYAADVLRLHETVTDFQANGEALNRVMMAIEHLMLVHFIRMFVHHQAQDVLSETAFFVDGPLAVFGEAAWIHKPILRYIHTMNRRLLQASRPPLLIVGLQKTGQLTDYGRIIDRHVDADRLLLVDDDFRYRWILQRDRAQRFFGERTHYGQDFVYKARSGRMFVFAIPFPRSKTDQSEFTATRLDLDSYSPWLRRALRVVAELECDLYENATIPVVMAHRYTAISLIPGGRVLDIVGHEALQRPDRD